MGKDTAIEWADHTANFWEGCTQISPACDICYAMERAKRYGTVEWNGPPRHVKAGAQTLRAANRIGQAQRRVQIVFINSLSDWADKNADPAWRREMFDAIKAAPWVHALLLTKRIGMAEKLALDAGGWPANASLGASIVNQDEHDRDMGKLVQAKVRLGARLAFVSAEPLLGPIQFRTHGQIDAIIVGGESGAQARPMHPDWARSIRDQCAAAGVAFHFKQWGEWAPHDAHRVPPVRQERGWPTMYHTGKALAGRHLDGRMHDDFLPIDREKAAA